MGAIDKPKAMTSLTKSHFVSIAASLFITFIVVMTGFYSQITIHELEEKTAERSKARQSILEIETLMSAIKDAETGQRGFLLTGREAYLGPYNQAILSIPYQMNIINQLFSENSEQRERLKKIETLVTKKQAELEETIALRRTKGLEYAMKVVSTDQGRGIMISIRELVREMETSEKLVVDDLNVQIANHLRLHMEVIFIGSFSSIFFFLIAVVVLELAQRRRVKVENELTVTNERLHQQSEKLKAINKVQHALATAGLEQKKIMETVVVETQELMNADGSIIELIENDELVYHYASGIGVPNVGLKIKRQGSFSGLSLAQGRVLICSDTETDRRVNRDACRRTKIRSMLVAPIFYDNTNIGVLKVAASTPNRFTDEHIQSLELILGLLSASLGQAQAYAEKTRAKELADQASKVKSQFVANMSHEIRTPLNGIIGMTELLLTSGLNNDQIELAKTLRMSGDSLLTLVNDVLDVAKIESGKLEFEELDFELVSSMQDVVKLFRPAAEKKGLKIDLDIQGPTPMYVKGDPSRLRQVLSNLIANAQKFTAQGSVHVSMMTARKTDTSVEVKFLVKDSGIGISQDIMPLLFQDFAQAEASTKRRFGGTGLGLSISKKLVERMGGQIGVESKEGEGSTFWFTISFKPGVKEEQLYASIDKIPVVTPTSKSLRILVVDDNQVNQTIGVRMVKRLGFHADAVANGKEAISALQDRPYDLILMDCQMPIMDGYEATEHIRQSKTLSNPNITIIAMTANAMQSDRERCLKSGMNDFLAKPIKPDTLSVVLQKWTAGQKAVA